MSARIEEAELTILDARCPTCSRFVRVVAVSYAPLTEGIVEVRGRCKAHGELVVTSYAVWP